MSKYNYGENKQITEHFNSKEFQCKCGRNHSIEINDKLIAKLEELHKALNCSKIIITSGYRCTQHDKAVGGNGSGQHTLGNAADIICYDSKNVPINSKIVCCVAQDLDFRGIANIDNTYTYTHVDVRPTGMWYGDETLGTNTVCMNFYKYYNLDKSKVYPQKQMKVTVEYDDHVYSGLLDEQL